jgi:DNA mismatch endonuclease (patch repair protein)
VADTLPPDKRSRLMALVGRRNTQPEMRVRSFLHRAGFRFALHRNDLPGCPDIVLSKHRIAIFVNGCFWHQHPSCPRARLPATRPDWWRKKLEGNVERDRRIRRKLRLMGWRVVTVWECRTRSSKRLEQILDKVRRML